MTDWETRFALQKDSYAPSHCFWIFRKFDQPIDQAQDPRGFFSDALTDQSAESLLEQLKATMKKIIPKDDVEVIKYLSLKLYNDKASPECVDYMRRWENVTKRV